MSAWQDYRLSARLFVLRTIYRCICRVVPSRRQRVVFISAPDAADNSWSLYVFMAATLEGYEFIWICRSPDDVRAQILAQCRTDGRNTCRVYGAKTFSARIAFLTAQYVFYSHWIYSFAIKAHGRKIVKLWHGMPLKDIRERSRKSGMCALHTPVDYSISTSAFYSSFISDVFHVRLQDVLEVGLPRNDGLIAPAPRTATLRSRLGVSEVSKLVFWLPTFRQSKYLATSDSRSISFMDEWPDGSLDEIQNVLSGSDIYLVIKPHPFDDVAAAELAAKQQVLANIKILTDEDLTECNVTLYEALSASSALISDISSVIVDYICLKQPIGVTTVSVEAYRRGLIPGVDPLLEACVQIRTLPGLCGFLKGHCSATLDWSTLHRYNELGAGDACQSLLGRLGLLCAS